MKKASLATRLTAAILTLSLLTVLPQIPRQMLSG